MLPILEHPGTLFYEVLTGVCALTSATVALFSHFGNSLPFRGSYLNGCKDKGFFRYLQENCDIFFALRKKMWVVVVASLLEMVFRIFI